MSEFDLTDGQRAFQAEVRALVEAEVAPRAADYNARGVYPAASIAALGRAGLMGLQVAPEWGGRGLGALEYVLAMEAVCRACAATGVILSVNNSLVCCPLERHGTPDQQTRWLRSLATGALLGAFALTEPEAGSDAAHIQMRAVPNGDSWVLDGEKRYITNGEEAGLFVVFAVTAPDAPRSRVTAFLVERGTPGFTTGPRRHKLGVQAASTVDLSFQGCRVPATQVLGAEGQGLRIAFEALDMGRVGIAAQALGIGQACLDAALRRVRERRQFGQRLADFQAIQFTLADMAVELEAARLLTYRAAARQDAGLPFAPAASMAKLFASEAANRAATKAVQLHGGLGYMREGTVERYFRDAKVTEIYEGTSEIQRLLIARHLLSLE
ncbi:MAG: acyl-CoA dehydrogenase family protein [Chloroflexota bacterium]